MRLGAYGWVCGCVGVCWQQAPSCPACPRPAVPACVECSILLRRGFSPPLWVADAARARTPACPGKRSARRRGSSWTPTSASLARATRGAPSPPLMSEASKACGLTRAAWPAPPGPRTETWPCSRAPGAEVAVFNRRLAGVNGTAASSRQLLPPPHSACACLLRAGWNMSCPFPGDLFVQFPSLQRLYVSYNNFTVRGRPLLDCTRELRLPCSSSAAGWAVRCCPAVRLAASLPACPAGAPARARACPPAYWYKSLAMLHAPLQGDINDAARTLSALRDLQEWAAAASNVRKLPAHAPEQQAGAMPSICCIRGRRSVASCPFDVAWAAASCVFVRFAPCVAAADWDAGRQHSVVQHDSGGC